MKHGIGRVEGEILRELTKILRKDIRDPHLSDITITAVEYTDDLSCATIYYSLLTEDPAKEEEAVEELGKTRGMMCHLLGQTLAAYKVPELISKRDTSIACGSEIDNLINQIKKQDQEREDKNK